jgi:hypothetical protein
MTRLFALVLAVVGGWFVYLAVQVGGELSFTQFTVPLYYVTVAFISFVNAILFVAADFVEE